MTVLAMLPFCVPIGFTQVINIDSAAKGITSPPEGINMAIIQATGQAVAMRDDGVDPTNTTGYFITQSGGSFPPFYYIGDLSKLKFRGTSAGAGVNILMYGRIT